MSEAVCGGTGYRVIAGSGCEAILGQVMILLSSVMLIFQFSMSIHHFNLIPPYSLN
jgi:hypothetical protein